MARSSRGPRPAASWAAEQRPRALPRIVRLGRPANDNVRRLKGLAFALYGTLAAGLVLFAFLHWHLI